jgi:phosphonate transport system ATP-binding protein
LEKTIHSTHSQATTDSQPVIGLTNVAKTYANGTVALQSVSLTVRRNEFVAVIGRSGAGKSTMLRCINMLVRPTTGRVELRGEDLAKLGGRRLRHERARIGMIFQSFNLIRRLTVLQNVLAGRLRFRRGLPGLLTSCTRWFPAHDRVVALQCLEKVGILELAYRRADTLSGGQQQRVAIARALAQEPDAILADEPIASLDPRSAEHVMTLLKTIQEQSGIPVLVNLHQVDVARTFATRIIGMARGGICFDGMPGTLMEHHLTDIYGGIANISNLRNEVESSAESLSPNRGQRWTAGDVLMEPKSLPASSPAPTTV